MNTADTKKDFATRARSYKVMSIALMNQFNAMINFDKNNNNDIAREKIKTRIQY